ncbi:NAD-dependent epimerase/dehydratase family protein [Pseudomonadota bacterium]
MNTIVITGGAGFVGSALAVYIKQGIEDCRVIAFDNLRRRGSERNLPKLNRFGVEFRHGDIRNWEDLEEFPANVDCVIEASAEASVQAGLSGSPQYLIQSNLNGAINCLELARLKEVALIFLSTSRVYSIPSLRCLDLLESESRMELKNYQSISGIGTHGVNESFPVSATRSLYGATKLSAEMFIEEYNSFYGTPSVINRCGVISGPGQFGKVDQGVYSLWVVNHVLREPLSYTGFGGTGKQVRDLLHIDDLCDAIFAQLEVLHGLNADIFNLGGGMSNAVSLKEYTDICRRYSGNRVSIDSVVDTNIVDIPWYVTDSRKFIDRFNWRPTRTVEHIVSDICNWLSNNKALQQSTFRLGRNAT